MVMKKLSTDNIDAVDFINIDAIDDESVLADGMIPDSRIVKLIDELEASNDHSDESGDV